MESDIGWNKDFPVFDMRVICPMSIESVLKME